MTHRGSLVTALAVLPLVALGCSDNNNDTPADPPAEDVNENEVDGDDGNGALDGAEVDGDDGNGALDGAED